MGFDDASQTGSSPVTLFAGTRTVTLDLDLVVRPWWTWDLGEPRLYDLAVWLDVDGHRTAEHVSSTGFRDLVLGEGWDLRLNGISLCLLLINPVLLSLAFRQPELGYKSTAAEHPQDGAET